METIKHRTVSVNGINMHVAEKGEGPIVLLLHGFPELWYAWRHQILGLAALGYHAVAPDLRGYGDTDAPSAVDSYTCLHVVGDLVALIDSMAAGEGVYLVAHDWGALIGWYLCMFRPEKVKAYVCMSVPYRPRNPKMKPIQAMRTFFGDDYYMCRFQEPGMENELKCYKTTEVLKRILTDRTPGPSRLPKSDPFSLKALNTPLPLPPWLSEDDIQYNANKFDQKGFTGGLNYYRAMDLNWELTAAWTGVKVKVPVIYVVGAEDMVYTTPGVKQYVHGGAFNNDVPLLDKVVVVPGVGHFLNQEIPEQSTAIIHDFISKFN